MGIHNLEFRSGWGAGSLPTSRFDRCASMLAAWILIVGLIWSLLFVDWLSSRQANREELANRFPGLIPAAWLDLTDATPAEGLEPDPDELAATAAGELGAIQQQPDWTTALEAVAEATRIAGQRLTQVNLNPGSDRRSVGRAGNASWGEQGGPGRGGQPGGVDLHRRWRFDFQAASWSEYKQLLVEMNVVLGVVHRESNEVLRVRLTETSASIESSDRFREKQTLYFGHQNEGLENWERRILSELGIPTENRWIVHFVDPQLQSELVELESAAAIGSGADPTQVLRTVFGVEGSAGQRRYQVVDQRFR